MSIKLSAAKALAYAQSSQRIEGLSMTKVGVDATRKMLSGELSYRDARAQILADAKKVIQKADKAPRKRVAILAR